MYFLAHFCCFFNGVLGVDLMIFPGSPTTNENGAWFSDNGANDAASPDSGAR